MTQADYLRAGNVFEVVIALCQEILDMYARLAELGVRERSQLSRDAEFLGIGYSTVVDHVVAGGCVHLVQLHAEVIQRLADREQELLREIER